MTIKTKPATDEYRDNWDRIFGGKLVEQLRDNDDLDAAEQVPDEVVKMQYDAANEIERLREVLGAIALSARTKAGMKELARAALYGGER